jgi:hypothetical protein
MHRIILSSVACPALSYFFSTLSKKGKIFGRGGGEGTGHQMCFDFLYDFCPKYFHSKNWARYDEKCILVSMESNTSAILTKLGFYLQIFEKYSNIKFHENSPSGSRDVPCGRTDRHEQLTVASRHSTNAPKKLPIITSEGRTWPADTWMTCWVLSVALVRFLISVHDQSKCLQGCYLIRKDILINTMAEPFSA